MGLRHRLAVVAQAFDMKLDRFADELLGLVSSLANRNAAGKVGHVRSNAILGLFENDEVFHAVSPLLHQTCLLQDTSKRSGRHVKTRATGDSNPPPLHGITKLSITTSS